MRNFEKNIKTKADAFQMNPTPDSFDKVMASLEQKKKRRSIFWLWILIPGILIAGSGSIGLYQLLLPTSLKSNYIGQPTSIVPFKYNAEKMNMIEQKPASQTHSSHSETRSLNQNEVINQTDLSQHNNTTKIPQHNTIQTKVKMAEEKTSNNVDTKYSNDITENNHLHSTTIATQNMDQNNLTLFSVRNKELFITTNKIIPYQLPSIDNSLRLNPNLVISSLNYPPIIRPEKFSRFSLGIYSDLGVSKAIFNDTNKDSISSLYYNARNQTNIFLFSYSAGLQFRYSPIKCLAIETGVGFTHYESNQMVMDANISVSSTDLEYYPDTALTLSNPNAVSKLYSNVYDYVSIPLKVYYQNKWKWIGLEAGGGIIFDVPVNTRSYVANENNGFSFLEHDVNKSRLNKFGVQLSVNANVVFHIKKIGVFAGPAFKYRLNSMFDDNYIIRQQNYFIGGQIGIRYNF